ncbi:Gfo/Idh/MocA family oxidoreductase [Lutimaribacter sp. EGI FJ00015]|uniref:Gfo/Idh/MocA family oxidoreductase n=1 Tax=Lutimaribacter degradans TaxID=2945989 RepID=A0ACC5ZYJ9_9RHOB|nr:Gfo/Idh/MocA family oxidoreductase [Lutimaribacter sp. EGI FJ00013]MCM2563175.1 Gfo/Idh/MocA family oxidoreductase [Lutimaribacter sp. EGI FJ00013]MCO0614354.1 Gfo/Idh/MocA family oxidoreductase [Lutimaribacter sp. EGI FJ00015]MCO0637164.1 Gfo/Idh/MocA family oxidoreductase [Lutimaribacter sp. EGI FJ00014]
MAIRTAIIGLGIMGRRLLGQMQQHPGYELTAMWDPDKAACAAAQDMAPDTPMVASAEAAIDAADLVYLACPPGPRKTYALAAASAGKAVFLEKPLGVDVAESEDLVAQLAQHGTPAAVNFTQASGPAMTNTVAAAQSGEMGQLLGADIVLNYAAWPRAWQKAADWLRFRDEGGMTREVISHFLFFSERLLGPLHVVSAEPSYPDDPALCETHLLARLENENGLPVSILASVGGAQPDRQELTIKGSAQSRRITDFYVEWISDGGDFVLANSLPEDARANSLKQQLDALEKCIASQPNALATPAEALRVQKLVERMLRGPGA